MSDSAESIQLLHAAFVAPMDGPVLRDAGVVIGEGKVLAVGGPRRLRVEYPQAAVTDLGNAAILPGLINAHCHLELSALARPAAPASFIDWLKNVITQAVAKADDALFFLDGALKVGIPQSLRSGVTTIGDISATRASKVIRHGIAASCGPRLVSYGEVTAMGQRRDQLEARIAVAIDPADASSMVRLGVSPHAPYSVEAAGYRRCLEVARAQNLPLATHLAESPYEGEFLATHSGPLRELWDWMGAWDDRVPKFEGGAIRYAKALGLLEYPSLLAHVNYCDDEELSILADGRASVVYCPRTHQYFGHPPHRFREMLARDVNVALGTDSCASSPDLNLLEDLRLVHQIAPEISAEELWGMVTVRGARAIDATESVGSLTPGKQADLVAFAVSTGNPLLEIVESNRVADKLWISGTAIDAT